MDEIYLAEKIGSQVKSFFPEYTNFTNIQIGERMIEKYPELKNLNNSNEIKEKLIEIRSKNLTQNSNNSLLQEMQATGIQPENSPQNRPALDEIFGYSEQPIYTEQYKPIWFERNSEYIGISIFILILIFFIFILYKICRLVPKIYKKIEKWLDK